jgi:hypothetical protein
MKKNQNHVFSHKDMHLTEKGTPAKAARPHLVLGEIRNPYSPVGWYGARPL